MGLHKGQGVGWFAVRLHGEASQGAGRRMFRGDAARWGFTRRGVGWFKVRLHGGASQGAGRMTGYEGVPNIFKILHELVTVLKAKSCECRTLLRLSSVS